MIDGIPGNANRGFKVADELRPGFDPDRGDRALPPEMLAAARAFLRLRFPALAGAPLLGSEVCQYELARTRIPHRSSPGASNVWLAGGGSGHGFKMGPAIGEYATRGGPRAGPAGCRLQAGQVATCVGPILAAHGPGGRDDFTFTPGIFRACMARLDSGRPLRFGGEARQRGVRPALHASRSSGDAGSCATTRADWLIRHASVVDVRDGARPG